ncbi:MAG: hypothetical protein ABI671_12700 [Burkholderiales bacterium]
MKGLTRQAALAAVALALLGAALLVKLRFDSDMQADLQATDASRLRTAAATLDREHDDAAHLVGLPVLVGTAPGAQPGHQGGVRDPA